MGELVIATLVLLLLGGIGSGKDADEGNGKRPIGPIGPVPGPGGDGTRWRPTPGSIPGSILDQFDFDGTDLYIDPECQYVLEGARFFDVDQILNAEDYAGAVAAESRYAEGFIKTLIPESQESDPIRIAQRVVQLYAPMCAEVDPSEWGPAMLAWYNDFLDRVITWIDWSTGEIPYGGAEAG